MPATHPTPAMGIPPTEATPEPGAIDSVPTAKALELALRQALQPSDLQVLDESAAHAGHAGANGLGRGTHFRVRIGGPALAGRTRVAQHRLVYDALRAFTDAGLHALAIEILPSHPI